MTAQDAYTPISDQSSLQLIASYSPHPPVTLVIECLDGSKHGWPMHLTTHWVLTPSNAQRMQSLRIEMGDGANIELEGSRLEEIVSALEDGRGGKIRAQDLRYLSLAAADGAYVSEATVAFPEAQ